MQPDLHASTITVSEKLTYKLAAISYKEISFEDSLIREHSRQTGIPFTILIVWIKEISHFQKLDKIVPILTLRSISVFIFFIIFSQQACNHSCAAHNKPDGFNKIMKT
jgi:hypothetical protein